VGFGGVGKGGVGEGVVGKGGVGIGGVGDEEVGDGAIGLLSPFTITSTQLKNCSGRGGSPVDGNG
jgi:hypothetical protein